MTVNHTFPSPAPAKEPSNGKKLFAQTNPTSKTTEQREKNPARTNSQSSLKRDQSRRARHAADQRHSRSYNSRQECFHNDGDGEVSTSADKIRLYHDKNKLTARNYRVRQRREARTIQETVRLEEENMELNTQLHGLKGEIGELRALAPDHQRCACHIMRYDRDHVESKEPRFSCAGAEKMVRVKSGQVSRCVVRRPAFSSKRPEMMMIVSEVELH
jgi:hypothetical protein